jgi:hypothetical protein
MIKKPTDRHYIPNEELCKRNLEYKKGRFTRRKKPRGRAFCVGRKKGQVLC